VTRLNTVTYYIHINKLNGRSDFAKLAEKLYDRGYDDKVEYHPGGQIGDTIDWVSPHLKFVEEQDALAYVLAYGGTILRELPTYIIAGG